MLWTERWMCWIKSVLFHIMEPKKNFTMGWNLSRNLRIGNEPCIDMEEHSMHRKGKCKGPEKGACASVHGLRKRPKQEVEMSTLIHENWYERMCQWTGHQYDTSCLTRTKRKGLLFRVFWLRHTNYFNFKFNSPPMKWKYPFLPCLVHERALWPESFIYY